MSWLRAQRVFARRVRLRARIVLVAGVTPMLVNSLVPVALAQYPGKVGKSSEAPPVLRSVAVLEWIGEPGKPSASRLVPVTVFDGEHLNDGTIYLDRPQPMALESGVEYELQKDGKAQGIFDVFGAGESQGAWRGYGVWKQLSAAAQKASSESLNTSALYAPIGDADDDKPVLKRKHPKEPDADAGKDAGTKTGGGIGSGSSSPGSANSGASGSSGSSTDAKSDDPDRPTLHRKTSDDSSNSNASAPVKTTVPAANVDPDRPTLHRSRKAEEAGMMETSTAAPDPDRPRLMRGKPDLGPEQAPRLEGLPPTMQQAVAVSDAANHTEHPWKYTWANPADEQKMKASLEAMARTALGMDAPAPKPVRKTTAASGKRPLVAKTPLAEPTPLVEEQFRVFELTYSGSATMVLTAASPAPPDGAGATDGAKDGAKDGQAPMALETPGIHRGKPAAAAAPAAPIKTATKTASTKTASTKSAPTKPAPKPVPQKFVTLIAQPDLYGGILVIYKSVTDAAHLDQTPRLRLVDAVDAMGDNRGELLFELRGDEQRQFALFRVLRGSAQQLFATVAIP